MIYFAAFYLIMSFFYKLFQFENHPIYSWIIGNTVRCTVNRGYVSVSVVIINTMSVSP